VNRTDRLYAMVEELRAAAPRSRNSRRLADQFEVSVRTIERDISALQQSGVPIWATPGPGGGYTVDPSMTLPPLNFTADEATAIAVALAVSGPIPFGDAARSALHKVAAAMSSTTLTDARDLASRIHVVQSEGEGEGQDERSDVMRAVETAVRSRRVLEIDYVDRQEHQTTGRQVEPYGLAGGERGWYLMGWCRLREGGRVFRLDRMVAARVTTEAAPARSFAEIGGESAPRWRQPRIE
jgi:predicted DNA-binding transcriptional regulator YafY